MHKLGGAAPTDRENRSADSLQSRLLAVALLSMGHIPVASTTLDFPEVARLRFPARPNADQQTRGSSPFAMVRTGDWPPCQGTILVITGDRAGQKD
jgi:hypothetical protein